MDVTKIINSLFERQNLTTDDTKHFLAAVMKGEVLSTQIAAFLVALRMKGETSDEIIGFIQAMRSQMIRVDLSDAIDVCGTGGDGSNSINVSTAVAFVVAGCGVKVAKHGNRAASSKSGAADVLEALGVNISLTAEQARAVCDKVGMVFLFAPLFHPATKHIAIVRKELKIRTIFNFLGPFLSPASVSRQLIGVPGFVVAEKLVEVAKRLHYEKLILASSQDGLDEISVFAKTDIFTIENNTIKQTTIDPKKFGFDYSSKKEIIGGSAKENAESLKAILHGEKGARRDIVIINSAVALLVAGTVKTIEEGITMAEHTVDSGLAKKILQNLIKETQKYA
ncbi:MAG TPA: anthranilate phosphoribosyltransferase [Methylomirabilota bacterium]|nr:anthranilate phosphoribosyltransferase [Methylomirabilota bacterium]